MQFSWKNPLKALPVLLLFAAYAGAAFGVAGNVQFVIGDVKLITRAGVTQALQKGAAIDEGDRIVTADGASAQIKMADGGFIAIRPNTDMGFDTYRYSGKEDGTESAIVSLLHGGFRTITGIIGRTNKQNYLVKTATATIGIRGTDHEPMVILAPQPGQVSIAAAGTYDKVNVGIAYIRNDAGSVDIHRNQVGFAPETKAPPMVLPRIPPFYKPTPAPGPQKAKEEAKDEGKKEAAQSAAAPAKSAEEQKAAAPAEKAAAAPAETAAEAPAPIRSTAVVDPTSTVTTAPAAAPVATAPAAVAPVVAVTATDASGSTVNTTTQTLTSSTGTTTSVSQGAFALEAQAAADAAAASASALNMLLTSAASTAASTTVSSAVSAAQSALSSASTAGTGIAALTIDAGLAASNATAAAALATTATSQVSAATTKHNANNANGSFADSTIAVPAFAALNAANTALQTANDSIQSAAGTVTSQNTTLTSTQTSASAALSAANQALGAANTALSALTAAGVATSTTASSLLSVAQSAATVAQSAATQAKTLQSTGDFNGAQAQLAIAQQQAQAAANSLANAAQIIAAVVSANTAQLAATSITADTSAGLLNAATSAQSSGAGAVSTTSTQLATAQAQALIVQPNSVLAQYNNPAVATTDGFFHGVFGAKPVTGGVEFADMGNSAGNGNANNAYVLDGSKNLVEIRSGVYSRFGANYSGQFINNADITFTGGVAKDQYNDPNGVFYIGRWQGGQINVNDLAATAPIAPFSDALGSNSVSWILSMFPDNSALSNFAGPINNTQLLTGMANYTLAGATRPTDGFGNVGTLNSATLAANFNSQTVNASLGMSFSTTDTVNISKRNLSLSANATNVPIYGLIFSQHLASPALSCAGADCNPAGYSGSLSAAFGANASAGVTTGAVGPAAGLSYDFSPNITSTSAPPNAPISDLISGFAVLNTTTAPTVGVTNFSSTADLRDQVLWTTNQVSGTNPTTTYIVSDKHQEDLTNNPPGTSTMLQGPRNNTNFLFDASGNLVRVFDTPHVVFDLGNDVAGSTTQFTAPTPLAHAQLSFGGGSATSENYFDPSTQVRFGRWTGGVVNVTDLTTGNSYIESLTAPGGAARSVQWVVAQMPSSIPLIGEFQYRRINGTSGTPSFATAPTDSYGNLGTLEGARLSADFTNMTASAGIRISMPSGPAGSLGIQNLSSHFDNAPILSGEFNVSTGSDNPPGTDNLHVRCFGAGCASDMTSGVSAYGGRIRGAFDSATGNADTADGAFLRYTFNTLYGAFAVTPPTGRVVDDYITGLVAFQQGPQIGLPTAASGVYSLAAPTAPVTALTSYAYNNAGNVFTTSERNWVDHPSSTNLTLDASGNLVSITDDNNQHGDNNAITLSGGTANPATPIALAIGSTTTATDGTILLGWQQPTGTTALTVSGTDFNGCFGTTGCANSARTVLGDGLAWVRGPAPFPDYLPGAIASYSNSGGTVVTGTANYTLGASILHDQNGAAGTVMSATLGVNFNTASVDFDMTAATGAGTWNANASGIKLEQQGGFNAFTPGGTITTNPTTPTGGNVHTHDNLTVTLNGTSGFGNIQGQLMGIGLGGAGVTYSLNSSCGTLSCPNERASGALGFTIGGSQPFTFSVSEPYSTLTAYQLVAFTSGMNAAGAAVNPSTGQLVAPEENNRIQGGFVSPYRTQTVNGMPVALDSEFPVVVTQTQPSTCTTGCTDVNVHNIPVVYAVTGASGPASIGTATLLQSGIDAATGIRWGRYGNGTIGVNDRITGASLGTVNVTNQNTHFIMTSVQSGPTVLPISGTFNYTFAGGTSPTDSKGNVGTALTAANASLTADFLHQTVDAALSNLVVGGNTWGASATGIPIIGNVFQAEKKLGGGGNLTVTSSLGTNTAGQLAGGFTGATGNGVGMLYSLNHGGNSATNSAAVTVSGVAIFRH